MMSHFSPLPGKVLVLQSSPAYPDTQLQVNSPELLLQVPPFLQGLGEHGSFGAVSVKIERDVSNTSNTKDFV